MLRTTLIQQIPKVNKFITFGKARYYLPNSYVFNTLASPQGHIMNLQEHTVVGSAQENVAAASDSNTFASRIKVLIQRVGSVTAIARMCGFSEGVVRSWRDGNTDPSRARCVTLARTLGISLVWLVAGEGALQADPAKASFGEQRSSEKFTPQRLADHLQKEGMASIDVIDTQRLNTALRILQAELNVTCSSLSLSENSDLIAKLYEILGPQGAQADPLAMMTFSRGLGDRIRQARETA